MCCIGARILGQYVPVEKDEGAQSLVLGGRADTLGHCKVREERPDLVGTHHGGVPTSVEEKESPDPAPVGLLGAFAVVEGSDYCARAIQVP
jgi:hypothetical protein